MEKDPFLNFISDLSEKIKISREHKQIMERVNTPGTTVDESKASLENLILTIKEKIENTVVKKTISPSLSSTEVLPVTSSFVKVVAEEENNFTEFVDKLKNILSKPRTPESLKTETISTSGAPTLSASNNIALSASDTTTKKYVTGLDKPKEKNNKTKKYVNELEKVKDAVQVEKEDTKVTEIKKLIEDYAEKYIKKALVMAEYAGGGGTNAVQYAEGGTMDGDLNVNGNYLSGGVNLLDIFALQPDLDNQTLSYNESNYDLSISNGNTVNLSSINTTFNANSGKYESNFTTTNNNSAQWSEAYTNLVTNSALYLSGYVDNRYFYKDINFTASPNTKYSTGTNYDSITATLPSNAVIGDSVEFFDADGMWDINPLIVNNNGYNIESVYDSLSCDVRYGIFKLINTTPNTLGWRIIPLPNHSNVSNTYKFLELGANLLPDSVSASYCGSSFVSLSTMNVQRSNSTPTFSNSFLRSNFTTSNLWYIYNANTGTQYYSAAGLPYSFPSTGWASISPSYDPPPTFTSSGPNLSSYFYSVIPDLSSSDSYITNNYLTLNAYISSTNIPNIGTLSLFYIPFSSIDLSYFKSLSSLGIVQNTYTSSFLSSIDLRRNVNLYTVTLNSISNLKSVDLQNNNILKAINISQNTNLETILFPRKNKTYSSINLNLNTNIKSISFEGLSALPGNASASLTLASCSKLSSVELKDIIWGKNSPYSGNLQCYSNSNLVNFSITGCNANVADFFNNNNLKDIDLSTNSLTSLNIFSSPSLSSLYLPQNLKSLNMSSCSKLSSFTFLDNMLTTINANNYRSGNINYATTGSRSSNSNDSFINLLERNYTINPIEIDAQPFPSRPLGYVSSQDSDSITVMCPISTRNDKPALYTSQYDYYSTRFNVLTGEYLKVSETYNNRDVWQNPNNYFILFNETLSGWTLVGPLSTSTNILLSASESYVEWGTPPSVGWFGKAFQSGGFTGGISYNPATFGSVWGQSTTVASTKNTLFSSFFWGSNNGYDYANQGYLAQGQGRMFGLPSAGYNSSFYWKDYDFTGLLYNTGATPMNTGRGALISPIHFLCQNHYLPWGGSGTTGQGQSLVLYNADGTTTTRTVLSSVQYPAGSDTRVGILNSPVTNTFYPVASGSLFCSNVTTSFNKLSCFLVGPSQNSRCGLMPIRASGTSFSWYFSPVRYNTMSNSFYKDSYSVPRSLIFGESIAGGDSSTQVWFLSAETKRPILIGGIQFGSGGGPAFGADPYIPFLKGAMDNLSNQFSLPIYSPILVDK